MKKKLLAIFLTLAMAFTLIVPAFAQEPVKAVWTDGFGFHCNADGSNGATSVTYDGQTIKKGGTQKKFFSKLSITLVWVEEKMWSLDVKDISCDSCGSSDWVTYSNNSGEPPNGKNIQATHPKEGDPSTPPVLIPETSIEVIKVWVDDNDAAGKRPDKITFKLHRDGIEIDDYEMKSPWDAYTFDNLPMNDEFDLDHEYNYTVVEDAVEGYDSVNGGIVDDVITFTNTLKPTSKPELPELNVNVEKKVIAGAFDLATDNEDIAWQDSISVTQNGDLIVTWKIKITIENNDEQQGFYLWDQLNGMSFEPDTEVYYESDVIYVRQTITEAGTYNNVVKLFLEENDGEFKDEDIIDDDEATVVLSRPGGPGTDTSTTPSGGGGDLITNYDTASPSSNNETIGFLLLDEPFTPLGVTEIPEDIIDIKDEDPPLSFLPKTGLSSVAQTWGLGGFFSLLMAALSLRFWRKEKNSDNEE